MGQFGCVRIANYTLGILLQMSDLWRNDGLLLITVTGTNKGG
jgi:hypothetical protein